MFLHPHPASAGPTAETPIMMLFHFDELQAGDGMNNLSGGIKDSITPSKVARIMVGNHFIDGFGEF
jgi:hypothetical protein